MKVIKPITLSLLHKAFQFQGVNQFCVCALGFFKLGAEHTRFLIESEEYPKALKGLPQGQPLDMVMPKGEAEFLLCGNAYPPGGEAKSSLDVGVRVDKVSKVIRVYGNRQWYYGSLGLFKTTAPEKFTRMPLGYDQAYGALDYGFNNLGKGYYGNTFAWLYGQRSADMPNLEYPQQPVKDHKKHYMPASFGPMDVMWKQRSQWVGTYDQNWIKNNFPGLANDADMRLHNLAAEDQRKAGFWKGAEPYRLRGVHPQIPEITGYLPDFRVKALLQLQDPNEQQSQDDAQLAYRSLDLKADTVWFFPEDDLGVMVYRAVTPVIDPDALDIKTLLLAYESSAEEDRPSQHYVEQICLRTDRSTVAGQALNEAALIPTQPEAVLKVQADKKSQQESLKEQRTQKIIAELEKDLDIPDVPSEPAPEPGLKTPEITHQEISKFELPEALSTPLSLEDIANGGIDLSAALESVEEQKALLESQRDQALKDVESQVAEFIAEIEEAVPHKDEQAIDDAWQKALEKAEHLPVDLHPVKGSLKDDVQQLIELLESNTDQGQGADKQADFDQLEPLQRQAKRSQTKIDDKRERLPEVVASKLGAWLLDLASKGEPLAGRDLADLAAPSIKLSGLDLREINFEGANLQGVDFSGAELSGANFLGAELQAANFSGCNLEETNFSHAQLQFANFEQAQLVNARLVEADLRDTTFVGADLSKAVMNKACLDKADLSSVQFSQTLMPEVTALHSNWRRANLIQSVLFKAELEGADFSEANLERVICGDLNAKCTTWIKTKAVRSFFGGDNSDFSDSCWEGAEFKTCGFRGANFSEAKARNAIFFQCDFGNSRMSLVDLNKAVLCRSLFSGADLQGVKLIKADLNQAICRGTDFTDADLTNSNLFHADMSNAVLVNTCLDNVLEKIA